MTITFALALLLQVITIAVLAIASAARGCAAL